jgi:hypothetical protein
MDKQTEANQLLHIETNPVKIVYLNHVMLEGNMKQIIQLEKQLAKITKDFNEAQMIQCIKLCNGTLKMDDI